MLYLLYHHWKIVLWRFLRKRIKHFWIAWNIIVNIFGCITVRTKFSKHSLDESHLMHSILKINLLFLSQPCKTIQCQESIHLMKEHCFHSFHPLVFYKQVGLVNSQSKQVGVPRHHCFNGPYHTFTYNKKAVSDFKDICSLGSVLAQAKCSSTG